MYYLIVTTNAHVKYVFWHYAIPIIGIINCSPLGSHAYILIGWLKINKENTLLQCATLYIFLVNNYVISPKKRRYSYSLIAVNGKSTRKVFIILMTIVMYELNCAGTAMKTGVIQGLTRINKM